MVNKKAAIEAPLKLDLHIHSAERSLCARAKETEQIEAAVAAGLDGLAFTDHDRLVPAGRLLALNRKFAPFRIYGGIEVTLPDDEHIIVLGVQEPALESRHWTYSTLWHFVQQHGGMMILAHPFRFRDAIHAPIDRYPPQGIEVYSTNTSSRDEARIRELAAQLGIKLVANSDAHTTLPVGRFYNQVESLPLSDPELVAALMNGSQPFKE